MKAHSFLLDVGPDLQTVLRLESLYVPDREKFLPDRRQSGREMPRLV